MHRSSQLMDGLLEKTDLLLLLVFLGPSSGHILTCHCWNGTECHSNGYCVHGCENGWSGPGCQLGNVAQSKETRQSSTFYDYSYWYNSSNAVDGLLPIGPFRDGNSAVYCSHTVPQNISHSAWWLVILGTNHSYVITNVTIYNRKDDAAPRLTNFVIMYSNEVQGDPDRNESIWHIFAQETGAVSETKTYTSSRPTVAKRVAVYLTAQNYSMNGGNAKAILTLCEVQVYGYQQYDCPIGFTGPGCLLRSCDTCESSGGNCTGEYGNCRYDVCPDRSLLPPECWITLSNYSGMDIRATATCNSLLFLIDPPDTKPNVEASLLLLQVTKSADRQMVVNKRLSVQGTSAASFKFDDAAMDTSYEVSVKPVYCDTASYPCFYATSSKEFTMRTGKREYDFIRNNSCVVVNMKSAIAACEAPSAIQVTCQSKGVDSGTVNSSSSTVCGLTKGRYNCSVVAFINAKTIEKQSADIITEPLLTSPEPEKDMAVVAGSIGASVAVLVVIAAGIIVFVYCRRQRSTSSGTSLVAQDAKTNARHTRSTAVNETRLPTSYSARPVVEDDEQTYCNITGMKLPQFQLYMQDEPLIARRFSELQSNEAHPCTQGLAPENKGKNRFQNILPYDVNRVRLDSATNDYINASYIDGCCRPKEYIAAQGPSSKTVEDFWHMLWQEKCSVIIMLTDYIEHTKRKCEKYFPFSPTNAIDIEVTVRSTTVFDTHTVTALNVRQGSEVRLVHHFHFLAWPDQSVPSHNAEVLLFYSRICRHLKRQPSRGPLIVHCSAGVGRTGAYIAFDYLLQRYQSDSTVNVDSCVVTLRDQRMLMVQTKEQYIFLHRVVLYSLKTNRYIYDPALLPTLARVGTSPGSSLNSGMTIEWQELQALVPTFDEQSFATAVLPENRNKNRRNHILALECKRPIIRSQDGGTHVYINAVYCNGCYSNRAFIATQLPLPGTVDEFWLMVYDCQPSCIVLLHDLSPQDEDCPRYWPEPGHSFTAGRLEVKCDLGWKEESTSNARIPAYGISLSPASGRFTTSQTVSTKLLTPSLWATSSTELPSNAYDLVTVANALRTHCVEAPQQPIIVQCRDGATQSGFFLSAVNALHRLIEIEQVSVFHTVDLLRTSRPEFVTSEGQYRFIYQILEAFHDSSNIYANT